MQSHISSSQESKSSNVSPLTIQENGLVYAVPKEVGSTHNDMRVRILFSSAFPGEVKIEISNNTSTIIVPITDRKIDIPEIADQIFLAKNIFDIERIEINSREFQYIRIYFSNKSKLDLTYVPVESRVYNPTAQELELINAVKANDIKQVTSLLTQKVSANTLNEQGSPLLIIAALKGYKNIVEQLVQHGANLEARLPTHAESTALAAVAMEFDSEKHLEIMNFLIMSGASISSRNKLGKSIFHYLKVKKIDIESWRRELLDWYSTQKSTVESAGKSLPIEVELSMRELSSMVGLVSITDLYGRRPVDDTIGPDEARDFFQVNFNYLYSFIMHTDAKDYVESWQHQDQDNTYCVNFKPNVRTDQKRQAWEAITNILKSLKVEKNTGVDTEDKIVIGMATNATSALFLGRRQSADVIIPRSDDFAIDQIYYVDEKNTIIIKIKPAYVNDTEVHATIQLGLAALGLRSAAQALTACPIESKPATAGMFSLPTSSSSSSSLPEMASTFSARKN